MNELPVPAAERTVLLLELLIKNPDGLTPAEILVTMDVTRSTLFALLKTLRLLGYVEQKTERGKYVPGPRLLGLLSSRLSDRIDLVDEFYTEGKRSGFEETVALIIPQDGQLFPVAQIESKDKVRSTFEIGKQISMKESAVGHLFNQPLKTEVEKNGYALDAIGDTIELAFPVCRDGATPDSAVVLSIPAYRKNDQTIRELIPHLGGMAAYLSYRLGARQYTPYSNLARFAYERTIPLSASEINDFLNGPWSARLACVKPDGSPHVIPVWYLWDGKSIITTAWEGSKWAEYVLSNPEISLTIDEPWLPFRRISARGLIKKLPEAKIEANKEMFQKQLSKKYIKTEVLHLPSDEIFRITPKSIKGWRGLQ